MALGRPSLFSSWPGIAGRRTASLPLAYVPAIHVFLVESLKDVDARHKAGHDEKAVLRPLIETACGTYQEESAAFTMPLALPKSICPAYFAFSAAITLPMSFIPAALVSAMTEAIAALTSASDICFGK